MWSRRMTSVMTADAPLVTMGSMSPSTTRFAFSIRILDSLTAPLEDHRWLRETRTLSVRRKSV